MIYLKNLDNNLLANVGNDLVLKLGFSKFGSIVVIGNSLRITILVKNFQVGQLSTKNDTSRVGRPMYDESI
jgi:hypothetical protein